MLTPRKVAEVWQAARYDTSNGELTFRQWGRYDGFHVTHGWWVTPYDWSLGISVDWERWRTTLRISAGCEVGPFYWSINFYPHGEE